MLCMSLHGECIMIMMFRKIYILFFVRIRPNFDLRWYVFPGNMIQLKINYSILNWPAFLFEKILSSFFIKTYLISLQYLYIQLSLRFKEQYKLFRYFVINKFQTILKMKIEVNVEATEIMLS